jgi:NADH:ubiquinone oxidoreductase subunit 2 (subunit N)
MTILPFVTICTIGAVVALFVQPHRRLARLVGLAALAAAFVAALTLSPNAAVSVGEVRLQSTWYAGLFLTAGTASCLLLCLLGLAAGWPDRLAPAALATFAGLAVAFSSLDPGVALIAVAVAATPAALVAVATLRATAEGPREAAPGELASGEATPGGQLLSVRLAELRTLALIVGATLLAATSPLRPNWTDDPTGLYAISFLALGLAVAVRCGVVPFHVPAARLSWAAERLGLPLALVWIPAGLALVALAWTADTYAVRSDWLTAAVVTVQVLAVATLVLGAIGAMLHDELEEIAVYSIVQDAGFILLALAVRNSSAGQSVRLWLLAFIVAKAALIAWVAALAWLFGSTHLQDLRGWLRRAPLLGLALLAIVLATLGWPGSSIFEARASLIRLGLPDQLRFLGPVAIALALVYYGRLIVVGLLSPGERVRSAEGERPRWRAPRTLQGRVEGPALELALELAGVSAGAYPAAATSGPEAPGSPLALKTDRLARADSGRRAGARRGPSRLGRLRRRAVSLWQLNHRLEASLLVVAFAALAVALAFGGLGASAASRSGTALTVVTSPTAQPSGSFSSPSPSLQPTPTASPAATPTATPSSTPAVPASSVASGSPRPSGVAPAASPTASPSGSD